MATADALPRLSEQQICQLATEQSFDRGKTYYRNGAIQNPTRQGAKLWAECWGSELYETNVTLGKHGDIVAEHCSCPYDWGGLCKHQVALLLTYLHQPQAFHALPPLAEMLASRNRDDLVALIDQMVQQQPQLLSLIELTSPRPAGKPMDVSTYRRQVQRALKRQDMETIVEELELLQKTAKQLMQQQDWGNSGLLYQVLLEETIAAYDDDLRDIDYDGGVAGMAQDFVEGLGQCLEQIQDSMLRTDWLTTFLEAYLKDLNLGGIDFAAGAADHLVDQATPEEWTWIESQVRDEIQRSDRWKRESLVNLLAERQEQTGNDAAANHLIHELGSPEQRAFLLVEEGKPEAAIAIAQQNVSHLPGVVVRLADALVAAGYSEVALDYMTGENTKGTYRGYGDWFIRYYEQQGDRASVLQWQLQRFQQSPSLPEFRDVRQLVQSIGTWDTVRLDLLKQLEQANQFAILIDIAIDEGDGDRALTLLKQANDWSRISYRAKVAKAVEKTQPAEAIALYLPLAERAIGQRNRDAYREAANYYKQVKALYKKLKAESDWQQYIRDIRAKHSNLRALQDELNKAGL